MPVPDARVELQIDGTWTDVTHHVVKSDGIKLSRGRSDEGRVVDPGAGSLTLLSPGGLYSNRNPNSQYYEKLPRNTPIRISTVAGETVLDVPQGVAGRATTPDHASLDITGDIDVRIDITPEEWGGSHGGYELFGKYLTTGNQRSWRFMITGEGEALFTWSTNGSTITERRSTLRLPFGPGKRAALRVTVDVDNGAGGYTITMYTAATIDGTWTQFDQLVTTAGTTSLFSSTAALEIGDITTVFFANVGRRIHAVEVRSGIGGTVVASPRFDQQAAGATSFTDSAGRAWTIDNGATITDRRTRVVHAVPHWPSHWHTSGHDVRAPIQTAGLLGRLGQGRKELASTLRRRIPSYSPLAYWPLEEAEEATQAYSPIDGVAPMTVTGFTFGQDDSLAGSGPLPAVASGGTMRGTVPRQTSGTGWMVEMIYNMSSAPGSDQEVFSWRTDGSLKRWRILMRSGVATVQAIDFENTALVNQAIGIGADLFQGWNRLQLRVFPASFNVLDWTVTWYNVGGVAGEFSTTTSAEPGIITQINTPFGTLPDLKVGHVSVFAFDDGDDPAAPYNGADDGFNGDTATERVARLASEEAHTVSASIYEGDPGRPSTQLGPQRQKKLLDLLQEAADADGGILYEDSARLALVYRDRQSMENQTPALVLDYAGGDVAPPFAPTEDDTRLRNDITVSRENGSSGRAVLETGPLSVDEVGLYDEAVTLNLYADDQPLQVAGWRLHIATWDEARYPTVRIMLHHRPDLIPAVTALQVGDRIRIEDTPSTMPPGPVDLIVQRIDDDMQPHRWDVALICSPAGPWTVGVLDDPVLGRGDTDGSELIAAVTDTATLLPVTATAGPKWIQDPAEMPFDMQFGGEEATVTAVTGVAQDAFTRSVSNGWGTADSGQAWATAGGTAANFSVNGTVGQHSITTLNAPRATTIAIVSPDVDVTFDFALSVVPTGDNVFIQSMARRVDSSNFYNARVQIAAGGAMTLSIRKTVAGVDTQLATFATGLTYVAATLYRLRFTVTGDALSASIWLASGTPPPAPQATATDSAFTAAGSVGLRTQAGASLSNVLPVTVSMDNLASTPQLMTVTRSVNGIVKAHSAGTAVRLAQPMIVAL
ncbi:hypothetical protein Q5762_07490 [Streptomyces sp. P9(2023)]|uniref:hypothetical protein n=1 Tax=Streptomyces sp. P9(2023) TaxID=3064394 RepID=UPI0028F40326|nr:hypothetical protein [Streptomyces sp. P9(2023)]MDT9688200.1 hypothetical protein [Streptomyces sp. P9(2023)]